MTTWRKHATHAEETRAVRAALVEAGYTTAKVGHGSGTAWGWLEIRATVPGPEHCTCATDGRVGRCDSCQAVWSKAHSDITGIALNVTSRQRGDHGGNIMAQIDFS